MNAIKEVKLEFQKLASILTSSSDNSYSTLTTQLIKLDEAIKKLSNEKVLDVQPISQSVSTKIK
jgi:hypothetical protein